MIFTDKFQGYEEPYNVGVLLPEIKITKREYESVGLDEKATNAEFLRAVCREKFVELGFDNKPNSKEYSQRIKTELETFEDLGFVDYILLNWDIIGRSKGKGIPIGAGRGSAAGSQVLYLLGVTGIDSVKHELFFERFVSRARAKKIEHNGVTYLDGSLLPDVDNDISYSRRHEVIEYIEEQYEGKTAKILTINTLTGKLCMRECCKLIDGVDEMEAGRVTASIPKLHGKVMGLAEAYKESDEFRKFADQYKDSYEVALKLEGLNKNSGVHPSGIAISNGQIADLMPLQLTDKGDLISGYDMNAVAELVVKFDVLGLRTLTVVDETLKDLGLTTDDIDIEDPEIYQYCQGEVSPQGLFQIEADTNYKVFRDIKPQNINEISDVLALARPGALLFVDDYINNKRYQKNIDSDYEFFSDILSYTGGIPIYQEQLMKMANKVGFSLEDSEQIRRSAAKKKPEEMALWKTRISEKVKENKLDESIGEALWEVAESSANYSFNKSHSISYAYLTAYTLWLKMKHPKEFYMSLLKMAKSEPDPHAEIAKISQELNAEGIKLYPPCLIKSKMDFSVEKEGIRYGLDSIKSVAEKSIPKLIDFRGKEASNKMEFFQVASASGINITIMASLIYAGAIQDYQGKNSRSYTALEAQAFNILTDREKREMTRVAKDYDYNVLETINACVKGKILDEKGKEIMTEKRFETFKKRYENYKKVFRMNNRYEDFSNWFFENSLLGYSYTKSLSEVFSKSFGQSITQIKDLKKNSNVSFVGHISEVDGPRISGAGNKYYRMQVSDETGNISVMLMNNKKEAKLDDFMKDNDLPEKGGIIHVKGKSNGDGDLIFGNSIVAVDKKVYLKFSQIKNDE